MTTIRDKQGRFQKGKSGNPAGRPKGSRHAATMAAQNLLQGEAETLTRVAVDKALEGDSAALKLCLERLLPIAKERPIPDYSLPKLETQEDVLNGLATVADDLAEGRLLPSEAASISGILSDFRRQHEIVELEDRIQRIEEALGEKRKV